MYERVLRQMQEEIRTRHYMMTLHAEEEMNNDLLSIFDVEGVILTGFVVERQKNLVSGGWKYPITGESLTASEMTVIAKLGDSRNVNRLLNTK